MDLPGTFVFDESTQDAVNPPPFIESIDPLVVPQEAAAEYMTPYPSAIDQVQAAMVHHAIPAAPFSVVTPASSSSVTSSLPFTPLISNTVVAHTPSSTSPVIAEQHHGGAIDHAAVIMAQISKKALKAQQELNVGKGNEAFSTYRDLQLQVQQVGSLLENLQLDHHEQYNVMNEPLQSSPGGLSASDDSRKRCASSLAMERPVKVFKAEPQEGHIPVEVTMTSFSTPSVPSMNGYSSVSVSRPASPFGRKMKPPSFPPMQQQPVMVSTTSTPSSLASGTFPVHPTYNRASFSESVLHTTRHSHSLSTGSIITSNVTNGKSIRTSGGTGRMSRSGSLSAPYPPHFNNYSSPWTTTPVATDAPPPAWPADTASTPISASSTTWTTSSTDTAQVLDEDDRSDDEDEDDKDHSNGGHGPFSSSGSSDVPQEYRQEVDRIFFEFLNKICSNLDATDSKGDPIHQTLMAKKMQRLDESKDFRPFKFRILAFTTAFLEELAHQGYTEDKIPMKKIRNYLWKQPHILRFNEDGKKVKSKGNHIWKIEAKKAGDGKWEFRPFHRKLAGMPQPIAYINQKWSWKPHIWDPQASWQNIPVQYSSPSLPSWLTWKDSTLSGVPPPDAQGCDITVVALFKLDGQECQLSHSFQIAVQPNPVFPCPPVPEIPRFNSEPNMSFSSVPNPSMAQRARAHEETITVAVLQNASQRLHSNTHPLGQPAHPEQRIAGIAVDQSLKAWDKIMTRNITTTRGDQMLASASQEVVAEAALVAPFTSARMSPVGNGPSVDEMAVVTGQAVAQAVTMVDNPTDQLRVITVAKDILKQHNNAIVSQYQPLPSSACHPQSSLVSYPVPVEYV